MVSTYANYRNTGELLNSNAEGFINSVEGDIASFLLPIENIAHKLRTEAEAGSFNISDTEFFLTFFKGAVASNPHLSDLVVIYPDGRLHTINYSVSDGTTVFSTENAPYDHVAYEYSQSWKQTGEVSWNEPYFRDGTTYIFVATPLFQDGHYVGAVLISTTVRHFSEIIDTLGNVYGTTGFILYGGDRVLAHPKIPYLSSIGLSEEDPLHSVTSLDDPFVSNILTKEPQFLGPNNSYSVYEVASSDARNFVLTRDISRFGTVPWTIGQYTSASEWDLQFRRMVTATGVSLGLVMVSIIAAFVLAKRIAAPVETAAESARRVSDLKLTDAKHLPPSRIDEFNSQASAFNHMLDGLRWFETYVPRKLVRQLIKTGDPTLVESREVELTVMFADIVGFTAYAEKMSPKQIAAELNQHFETLNRCIEDEGGTIDKYIGDSVLAFWGAPEAQSDHAERACRAALNARKAFMKKRIHNGIKIAIHTGPLIVGNIGAVGRMNYTVIGDTVNTCSRIEDLAGEVDSDDLVTILVSSTTAEALDTEFSLTTAGSFHVRGRSEEVTVYYLADGRIADAT
ncbi:MAG: adenylate/guanylate cyclase domain-containing protein [Pseudomonadota bacterium]